MLVVGEPKGQESFNYRQTQITVPDTSTQRWHRTCDSLIETQLGRRRNADIAPSGVRDVLSEEMNGGNFFEVRPRCMDSTVSIPIVPKQPDNLAMGRISVLNIYCYPGGYHAGGERCYD